MNEQKQFTVSLFFVWIIFVALFLPKIAVGVGATCESALSKSERAAADIWIFGIAPIVVSLTHHEDIKPDGTLYHSSRPADHPSDFIAGQNFDVLSSTGWVDLTNGPYKLHTPDTQGVFFLMQLIDAYSNTFFTLGTIDFGSQAKNFLLIGPGAEVREKDYPGFQLIRAPTSLVGLSGRFAVKHIHSEYERVNLMQKNLELVPWPVTQSKTKKDKGSYPKYSLSKALTIPWKVLAMDAEEYFSFFDYVRKESPLLPQDAEIKKKMLALGLMSSGRIKWSKLPSARREALTKGVECGKQIFANYLKQTLVNRTASGWSKAEITDGSFGTNYLRRAMVAVFAPSANVRKKAIYLANQIDDSGQQLLGEHLYKIHFPSKELPPAKAYWSLSVYNEQSLPISNAIDRYSIGSLDPELTRNSDGSIDIYFSSKEPGKEFKNWLPTPKDFFSVTLRIYWPEESALNGTWSPPAILKLK